MRSITLKGALLLLLQAAFTLAETTVTVIQDPNRTTTLSAGTTSTPSTQTTPPPSSSSSSSITSTEKIPASSSRRAGYMPASTVPNSDNGGAGTDHNSYSLSTGGLIAVIVVVVAVAIFGIVSIVLYVLAKRRNWRIRESIKRASRRLTGRTKQHPPRGSSKATKRKRSGGVLIGEKKAGTTVGYPPGQKRGMAVEIRDVEKGTSASGEEQNEQKAENGGGKWMQRLWGNDWK